MRKLLLLASSLLLTTLITSCSGIGEDTKNDNLDIKEVKIVNRLSDFEKDTNLKKAKVTNMTSENSQLFDMKILSVSRALKVENNPSKFVESEVPVYTKKNKGDPVTDSEGNPVYKVDENGEFLLNENGEKIPEVYEEDKYVVSSTTTIRQGIRDVVVNKYDTIEVTLQVLPSEESGLTSAEVYRDSLEYGLLSSKNYILELEDGSLVSPFIVKRGSDIRTFILEFYTMNSTESYDKFFNSDTWGEELKDENVNEIFALDFKNDKFGTPSYFKDDVTYSYEYIEEARNSIVAEEIEKYKILTSTPFE